MIYYYTFEYIDDWMYNKDLGYATGEFIGTEEEWQEYKKLESENYGTSWIKVQKREATKDEIEWANQYK